MSSTMGKFLLCEGFLPFCFFLDGKVALDGVRIPVAVFLCRNIWLEIKIGRLGNMASHVQHLVTINFAAGLQICSGAVVTLLVRQAYPVFALAKIWKAWKFPSNLTRSKVTAGLTPCEDIF